MTNIILLRISLNKFTRRAYRQAKWKEIQERSKRELRIKHSF
jgi:hypothetical protein